MVVPPLVGPVFGLIMVTVGAARVDVYVKSDPAVPALVPPDVVTNRLNVPGVGFASPVVAVISVDEATTTLVARMAALVP